VCSSDLPIVTGKPTNPTIRPSTATTTYKVYDPAYEHGKRGPARPTNGTPCKVAVSTIATCTTTTATRIGVTGAATLTTVKPKLRWTFDSRATWVTTKTPTTTRATICTSW
jgi:hypothetical protein